MMAAFDGGGEASQRLLFPLTLKLSPSEYSIVEDMQALFARAGFEAEPFGGRTVIVHARRTRTRGSTRSGACGRCWRSWPRGAS